MRPARRAPPWEAGWAPRGDDMAPMMRSRGPDGPFFRASTYQYHPRHLVFSLEGAWHHLYEDN
eukprot:3161064-Alexandrium_andersonii.AAC.1